jgi:hypothetical protein
MAFFIENEEGRSTAEDLMSNTNLPFTDRVMRFPLPNKFKAPQVDRYDGSGDQPFQPYGRLPCSSCTSW